mmetsp:Transcript_18676/g.26816  ORF Transcript_18676/g.26816 Transcript_18676/m.26816 type:complete len:110 (+) Transcript_18676:638-967(+)
MLINTDTLNTPRIIRARPSDANDALRDDDDFERERFSEGPHDADDDLDDIEDCYDEDGDPKLYQQQLMQKLIWATHKLPDFAHLRSNDGMAESNLQKVQSSSQVKELNW